MPAHIRHHHHKVRKLPSKPLLIGSSRTVAIRIGSDLRLCLFNPVGNGVINYIEDVKRRAAENVPNGTSDARIREPIIACAK